MSQLFAPYRAVGLVTDSTPYALVKRGKEHFINCSVGNAFQIYSCANLRLQFVSGLHPGLITGLIAYKDVTVTAVENKLYVWHRAKLVNVVDTKGDSIKLLYLFGELILVLDQSDVLRIYTTTPPQSFVTEVSLSFKSNPVTSILHPDTYLNKILVARQDGTIQLWNLKSSKIIYSFKGWNSPVICMAQSPAIDVIAFGLSNGSIVIHNVKADKTITTFRQRGAVISLAFRTDSEAWLASGDLRGQIAIWNLEKQCLLSLLPLAHGVGGDADVSALNVRENAKTTFDDEIDDEITRKSIPKGSGVTKLTFLAGEPVLVSSGADNALKMWLCEPTGARILRQRSGAAQPPGTVQFYQGFSDGGVGKDRELLCGGGQDRALRSLSLIQDAQSRELSQGKLAAKARRTGRHAVALKLPPITALDSCGARERYWDSVVTAHAGRSSARTWHYGDRRLGSHRLKITDQRAPSSRNGATVSRTITTVVMSNCGSFAFLGTAGGWIDKYNVQSGQHRGAALWSKSQSYAHRSSVTGLAADPLNRHLISASLDGTLKWWKFNTLAPMAELIIDAPATFTKLHCDGQLLAVACDDLIIRVYDAERRCLVRRFQPDLATDSDDLTESNDTSNDGEPAPILTKNKRQTTSPSASARKSRKTNDKHAIDTSNNDSQLTTIAAPALPTSMCFSPDARWLVVAAMDAIRVYDVPSGTMIDWFRTQRAVTSIDFSPFGDFIATTHVGKRGVYLWANQNYFSTCFLKSLPKVPQLADLPNSLRVRDSNDDYRTGKNELGYDDDDNEDDDNNVQNGTNVNSGNLDMSKYAEQLSNGMITLSNVPRSHWQALSQLDTIKARNKPIEPPKAPKAAPFFLPTLSGVRPEFIIDADTNDDDEKPSRIVDMASMGVRSPFVDALRRGASTDVECEQITAALASLSPSQVDMEIRQLRGKSNDDEQEALRAAIMGQENNFFCEHTRFLQYIAHELQNGRNFELIQAWLEVFLRIHSSDLLHNAAAQTVLRTVRERHNVIEERFSSLRTVSLCLVEHFAGLSTDF